MKYSGILWLALTAVVVHYSGCGDGPEILLSEQQEAARILNLGSPWSIDGPESVLSVPTGIDPADLTGLVITFDTSGEPDWIPSSFSASGAEEYLSTENARWGWGTTSGTEVITLTNASASEFTGVVIQEEQLRLTFEINSTGGRITGIDGSYTLQFSPD